MQRSERSDTDLVLAALAEESEAFGELFDRWFNSSWNVARTIVRDDDLAADVAQDALLAAWQRLDQLDDPDAFGGWLLRITRNRALTRLEREKRSRATGDDVVSGLRDRGLPDPTGAERPLGPDSISEVRDRQELVWAAAAALGEREVSLLDLHLRHGLSPAEIADELGVEANNAHQQLFRLRNRLGDAIGSYLLWRNGRPLCDGLAAAVGGDVAFDRSVARAVTRHQAACDHCSERRAALVDPGKLFAAAPLVLVPAQLKVGAAAALQSAGVPLGSHGTTGAGSNAADGGTSSGPTDGAPGPGGPDGGVGLLSADGPSAGAGDPTTVAPRAKPPSNTLAGRLSALAPAAKTGGAWLAAAAVLALIAVSVSQFLSDDGTSVAAIESEPTAQPLAGPTAEPADSSGPGSASGVLGSSTRTSGGPADNEQPETALRPPAGPATSSTSVRRPPSSPSTAATGETSNPVTTPTSSTTSSSTTAITVSTTGVTVTTPTTTATTPTTGTTRPPVDTTTSTTETTGTTGTTGTTPPPAPDPPTIIRFTSGRPSGPLLCQDRNQSPFQASWTTENTDSVTLGLPNGTHRGGPTGQYSFCGSTGDTISIVATGPGGQDKSSTRLG